MLIQSDELIDFCYRTFLNREADTEGKNYYLTRLQRENSWGEIIKEFLESPEFKRSNRKIDDRERFIANLYRYLLKREGSEEEINYWTGTEHEEGDLLRIFGESEEYRQKDGITLKDASGSLHGIMVRSEEIDGYLLYPGFDRVQLQEALNNKPFQLSDFLACMDFIAARGTIDTRSTCFLDLGANVGSTTVYALKGGYFDRAICIEASKLNYQFLAFNSQINGLTARMRAFNYGLADFIGEAEIVCNPDNCGDFRLEPVNPGESLFNEENYKKELTRFVTLDELLKRGILKPETIGFIWIDCQGSEGAIFRGGKEFFSRVSVPLYVEFWPYGMEKLAGKDNYFNFLRKYAAGMWRLVGGNFEAIDINFLERFYRENISTGEYIDILVMPE